MGLAVGIIGFGEAGRSIAAGLVAAGAGSVTVHDVRAEDVAVARQMAGEATAIGATLAAGPGELAERSTVILSLATASGALSAAMAMTAHLTPAHTYVDLNSISPARAVEVGEPVTSAGARYVDGAIMAAVPRHGHRVPMVLAGAAATELAAELGPLGMSVDVLPGAVGAASAVKMFRSLLVKGLEALVLETVLGASQWGADEAVLASMADALPSDDWSEIADYFVGRTVLHGTRRSHEMREVARTVRACGLAPHMAEAAAARIGWAAEFGVGETLPAADAGDYRTVIDALREAGAYGDVRPAAD